MQFATFLRWEKASRESIDFKRAYVDMAGDLIAGLLLSQIVYWHLPDDAGKSRLRVRREDQLWLVKTHEDWWHEIRISAKQAKRALALLESLGLIERQYHRFNGLRTTHIRILEDAFMRSWNEAMEADQDSSTDSPVSTKGTPRSVPKGPTERYQRDRPITETTTENTSENTATTSDAAAAASPSTTIPLRQQILEEIGVSRGVIPELLKLPRDGPYLARWLEWVQNGDHSGIKSVLGFAVAGIRVGDGAPGFEDAHDY